MAKLEDVLNYQLEYFAVLSLSLKQTKAYDVCAIGPIQNCVENVYP